MYTYIRRLLTPSPLPVRLLNPFPRSDHRGYFTSRRLLEELRPDAPIRLRLAYRRIITSMPRLSLKSRTKASLLAEWDLEVARMRAWSARVGSRRLEAWTAQKMVLPSITGLSGDERGAPKLEFRGRSARSTTAACAAPELTASIGIGWSGSYPLGYRQPLRLPPRRFLSASAMSINADANRSSSTGAFRQHSRIIEGRTKSLSERIAADAVSRHLFGRSQPVDPHRFGTAYRSEASNGRPARSRVARKATEDQYQE